MKLVGIKPSFVNRTGRSLLLTGHSQRMIVAEPSFELQKVDLSQTLTLEYFLQPFVVIMNEISWYQAVLCQQNGSILMTYLTFTADDCCGTIIPGSES
eukprot:scaffold10886_cov84-Cylindrotheca_fusiformis.AAC.1